MRSPLRPLVSIDRRVRDDPTAEEAGDDDNGNRPVEAAPVTLSPKWQRPIRGDDMESPAPEEVFTSTGCDVLLRCSPCRSKERAE